MSWIVPAYFAVGDETQAADWASKMLSKNKDEERRKKGSAK